MGHGREGQDDTTKQHRARHGRGHGHGIMDTGHVARGMARLEWSHARTVSVRRSRPANVMSRSGHYYSL